MAGRDPQLLEQAFAAFDEANAQDPSREGGLPKELLYGRRMSERLDRFAPDAADEVKLAARCQHLCRWESPRSEYPMTREGYYAWRENLAVLHGEKAAELLAPLGVDAAVIERIQALLRKDNFKADPDAQLLEDVVCLVFLEHYFEAFAAKHPEEKITDILRKTWAKMSTAGQAAALALPLSDAARALVVRALGE